MSDYWERRDKKNRELMDGVRARNERRRTIARLEKKIRILKKSYRGQNDWRRAKAEVMKHGGTWRAENGLTFVLRDNVLYVYYSEKSQSKMSIIAYDAPIPYTAELDVDIMSSQPGKPKMKLEDLNKEIERKVKAGTKAPGPAVERIVIVEKDWLSKISLKRWGTMEWKLHLKPTQETLNSPKRRVKGFHEDLIYPGDIFEVKH